ncbi:3-deoxy-D-arabino-heptulosonate 7-phosphate synthase [Verticiella sediminum]|uniref:3-deoxy-D-arabino-heptulosonate 7-phosphate synthase n=1 Tax=Verticiella sediminum TaxID=1247510 RepID=A0A556AVC0_9BURK|nr:3-deoxy-D-arabino-heptulosonate 7-phosphate synthase [Verticiella sediminum]TSH96325.1 3-deoxy-D-arabino-heptulosonate 7-phosphate synthase [Verticiella sediminum]
MSAPPLPSLLVSLLRDVPRRYRVPATPAEAASPDATRPAAALAIAIEQARIAARAGDPPDAEREQRFLAALARLIQDALHPGRGDPVFQAMVLRHRIPVVREFASLSAQAASDRRAIRQAVNAIAHPARQERTPPGPLRDTLAQVQALASAAAWPALKDALQALARRPEVAGQTPLARGVARALDAAALTRLTRLAVLGTDPEVQTYQALWARNGPRSGSQAAAAQGRTTRARGEAVEALTTQALQAVAQRLDAAENATGAYRVVTAMHVPPSLPGNADTAKTEWDAVLLRRAPATGHTAPVAWDVCLLAEAKASVDAATTDFPRLTRGLRLLASADAHADYRFQTREGAVTLRGASLAALGMPDDGLAAPILYCCDAPADSAPRLLGAASRMQLLSAPASLAYASRLAEGQTPDTDMLRDVWTQLRSSAAWRGVLQQYAVLRTVREHMVHVGDLADCAAEVARRS